MGTGQRLVGRSTGCCGRAFLCVNECDDSEGQVQPQEVRPRPTQDSSVPLPAGLTSWGCYGGESGAAHEFAVYKWDREAMQHWVRRLYAITDPLVLVRI